ncbi:MAG: YHS domain-containing protein [Deltaproteobacteria bacterium]|nr:YHS domain-containing protein [Deltaproteobacteria bacterium]
MRVLAGSLSLAFLVAGCGGGTPEPETAAEHHEEHEGDAEHGDPAAAADAQASFEGAPPVGAHALCPVSGEAFSVSAETQTAEYQGRTYAFCCPRCKGRFEANPASFVH